LVAYRTKKGWREGEFSRGSAIGRRNQLFAGSDAGAERAAIIYSPTVTCKLCVSDPFEYLRDVLGGKSEARSSKSEIKEFVKQSQFKADQRWRMVTNHLRRRHLLLRLRRMNLPRRRHRQSLSFWGLSSAWKKSSWSLR